MLNHNTLRAAVQEEKTSLSRHIFSCSSTCFFIIFHPRHVAVLLTRLKPNRENIVKTYRIKVTQEEHSRFGSQCFFWVFFTAARCRPEASLQKNSTFSSELFIQKRLNFSVWLMSFVILQGDPGPQGIQGPPGPKVMSFQKFARKCVYVCVSFVGCLRCVFFYHAQVLFCWCENFFFFLARMRKTIHFSWKQQKQFLCPLHCDHCSDYERLLMSGATDGATPDRSICWIYGVRSLTLITDTFSLLKTKMSTADCFFVFFFSTN